MAFEAVGKMFPLQRKDELDHHQIPYIPCQPDKSQQDLITLKSNNLPVNSSGKGHRPKERLFQLQDKKNNNNDGSNEYKLKRIMHRDIERQRRQEMANLYASVRSLLPLEYIKGKRSISDHMHEAVNYINYLQKKIVVLGVRRDELMKKSNLISSGGSSGNGRSGEICSSNSLTITVNPCGDGLEILIGSSLKETEEGTMFPLSRVLKKLLDLGINIVSCISTKANDRAVHRILTEAMGDPKFVDKMALQQKLTNVLTTRSDAE